MGAEPNPTKEIEDMTDYRIAAVSTATADSVRETLASPRYGHPAHVEVATGYGPCRHCLRLFAVGEERRILFTLDAFAGTGAPPLPGPVFIHHETCERYPEDGGFPRHLLAHPLTLSAYGPGRRLVAEERIDGGAVEPVLERLLAAPEVEYIQVHDTAAGCFDFRIERAEPAAAA